jgi:hypothetical protein
MRVSFNFKSKTTYRAFYGFGQAKWWFDFTLLPQLPLKTMLDLKVVVKIDNILSCMPDTMKNPVNVGKKQEY